MGEVIVIGAGITGLVCAWALKRLGIEVRLLEGSSRAGGAIRTHVTAGYCVESGPNTILPTAEASRMIKQIGLETEVVTTDARLPRFVYVRGRLRKVPFAALSVPGMLRALMEPLVRSQAPRGESVADFFRRRVGNEAHDRLVAPFVAGIYAGNSERLSLAATFPRLLELERQHRSILIGALRSRGRPIPAVADNIRRGNGNAAATPLGRAAD